MLTPGQEVETAVVAVSDDFIFLDLNAKSEGVLDRAELTDADGNVTVKEGDVIKVFFLGTKNGEMRFTTKISGDKADKSILENACSNGIPVEGHVEKEVKGGYEIRIGDVRAFCPYSQMGYRQKDSAEAYTGKTLVFKILEYKENGRNILVSNRAILEDEHNKRIAALKETLRENMVVTGTVKSLQSYGAFVDIDGIQALLPISEISAGRVDDIHTVLAEGQEIKASVIKLDWKNERISLSIKALLADPWDAAAEKYAPETKHTGTVAKVADYGVFVSLESGVDGLVHVSELKGENGFVNLRKMFKPGDKMAVQVKDVNPAQKRLSLRPVSTSEQDETVREYMENQNDTDTYNPFAALLKKK